MMWPSGIVVCPVQPALVGVARIEVKGGKLVRPFEVS
jgi:hypothetical protein